MNVLVVVSGGLTETLQATPLLRTLRAGLPEAHITLAAPSRAKQLADGLPAVDATLCLRSLSHRPPLGSGLAAWVALRRRRFDVAIVCSPRLRDCASVYMLGVPRRLGVANGLPGLLLSDRLRRRRRANNAASWVGLAGLLGIGTARSRPDFSPSDAARGHVEGLLSTVGIDPERIVVALAPGNGDADPGSADRRALRWPPDRYAHLANQMALRHGAAIVLLGPSDDRPMVDEAAIDVGATQQINLCGELTLDETAALLGRCDVLVGGDSPLLHLAAAMGTAAVGLFGPTDGRVRGPYGSRHRVIQALPEGRRHSARLERIRVEDALAGIEAGA